MTIDAARMLRDKGFKEKYRGYWCDGQFCLSCFGCEYNRKGVNYSIDAPSLAHAQKWLRDVHGMSVEVVYMGDGTWECDVWTIQENNRVGHPISGTTYEKALNAGIMHALKNMAV